MLALVGDLDSDQGKTVVGLDKLPIEPPYVVETSAAIFNPSGRWPAHVIIGSQAHRRGFENAIGGPIMAPRMCHTSGEFRHPELADPKKSREGARPTDNW